MEKIKHRVLIFWFSSHLYISDSISNKKSESVTELVWAVIRDTENVTKIQEDTQEVVETLEDDEDPHHGPVALAALVSRPDHCR